MAYTLTYSRQQLSEGEAVVISLNDTGLPNGTLVPFTISGIGIGLLDFAGLGSLSGNFVIQNDKSKITLNIANDLNTEGTESFVLSLTGPGRTESIGITILDTSQHLANIAEFFIKPDKEIVYEGQTVTFNVSGKNVAAGTVVPYILTGIQNADLYNLPVSGNLIFAANSTYDTTANLKLFILEDNITEGPENIVMLIYPTGAYSLELNGTTYVLDTSTSTSKALTVSANKNKIFEGESVTFTVAGKNVPAGTNVHYRIIPWTSWDQPNDLFPATDLNANDFVGLPSLYGSFPLLYEPFANATTNVSTVTFLTKDDFIFEPTEYFYLGAYTDTGLSSGSGIVGILDSGNTYLRSYATFTGNAVVKFLEPATLSANIGGMTFKAPGWEDTKGHLSDDMVVQGKSTYSVNESDVFYQPFSYVIKSSRSIEEWLLSVKNVLHPAGFAIFSEINNETPLENINYASIKSPKEDTDIGTYFTINADSAYLNSSNTTAIVDGSNVALTIDLVTLLSKPQ